LSWEYLHLLAHPFAIVFVITGAGVGMAGWALGREALEKYGIVTLLLAGMFALPSYFTGIAAADVAADRIFVRPSVVQTHRTWATWTAMALLTTGILAGFSFLQLSDKRLRHFVLVLGVLTAVLTGYTAYRGSLIWHGERPPPATAPTVSPAAVPAPEANAPSRAPHTVIPSASLPKDSSPKALR